MPATYKTNIVRVTCFLELSEKVVLRVGASNSNTIAVGVLVQQWK
jgi:hypothetical protein